jgi:hypothetical protein
MMGDKQPLLTEAQQKKQDKKNAAADKKAAKKKKGVHGGAVVEPAPDYSGGAEAAASAGGADASGAGGKTGPNVIGAIGSKKITGEPRFIPTYESMIVMRGKRTLCRFLKVIADVRLDYQLSKVLFEFKQSLENPAKQLYVLEKEEKGSKRFRRKKKKKRKSKKGEVR